MSRRPVQTQEFGSDSFLDVVCNVVGILIILMVLAGVRASRMPVVLPVAALPDAQEMAVPREPDVELVDIHMGEEEVAAPVVIAEPEPPRRLAPPEDLVSAAEALQKQLATLEGTVAATAEQIQRGRLQQAELETLLAQLRTQQQTQEATSRQIQQRRRASEIELDRLRRIFADLTITVQEQADKRPAGKTIEHRITPIGRTVTGKELHVRLLDNRVSVVPLDRLISRLQSQIERHKDWIAKSRQQLGQVGPLDGYSMHYVVERDSGTIADELRMGPGVFRISVTEWRVEAEGGLVTETPGEALQPGSHFMSALSLAEPESAITFWVYPDSFEAYTQLKAYCQQQNFMVAGRPLPAGIPIAGSPAGSKSTAQ